MPSVTVYIKPATYTALSKMDAPGNASVGMLISKAAEEYVARHGKGKNV